MAGPGGKILGQPLRRVVLFFVVLIGFPVLGFKEIPRLKQWWDSQHPPITASTVLAEKNKPRGRLAAGDGSTMQLPDDVVQTLEMKLATVKQAPPPEPLRLDGSLFLNANRLVHVNSRFPGEVVELGQLAEIAADDRTGMAKENKISRTVTFGDYVREGQLLAVIWSKDLGEKKSELVAALTQLKADEAKLERLEKLLTSGGIPGATVVQVRRDVDSDLIAIDRIERTLRSWKLNSEQIKAIHEEAENLRLRKGEWEKKLDDTWARVEVHAPMEGTVVEKNLAVGDIVGSDLDLFKIADLRRLDVLAQVYEEDIPLLESLAPEQRNWSIRVNSVPNAPPLEGHFDRIGNIIDPAQHTAFVMGWVDNSGGKLRAGQFISVSIQLPADPQEVAIPVSALVDQETESRVFVEVKSEGNDRQFRCRRVAPTRRRDDWVYVSSQPPPATSGTPIETLLVGERVVTHGGVELAAELDSLQTAANQAAKIQAISSEAGKTTR